MSLKSLEIDLAVFARGTQALTHATCSYLSEAAGICFEAEGHLSGVVGELSHNDKRQLTIRWPALDPRALSSHADLQDATEDGAAALAISAIPMVSEFQVIERSCKGTSFDYWLGMKDDDAPPFERKSFMEVSGILKDTDTKIRTRMAAKLEQVKERSFPRSGYAVIVGFSRPRICIEVTQ